MVIVPVLIGLCEIATAIFLLAVITTSLLRGRYKDRKYLEDACERLGLGKRWAPALAYAVLGGCVIMGVFILAQGIQWLLPKS